MPGNLKTNWLCIGRSGKTVDGREIKPEMITEAAETYDTSVYKGLIWPEHYRWANLGGVEAVRLQKNEEGGVDLEAILSPNEFYIGANSAGQKLFTSMELTPNFRGTGKWYLTGLGATDSPASAGTSEVRFSADAEAPLRSQPLEISLDSTPPEKPSLFARLFSRHEDTDMADKAALEALRQQLEELKTLFSTLKTTGEKQDEPPKGPTVEELAAKVKELEEKFSSQQQAADGEDKVAKLEKALEELTASFNKALSEEHHGTTRSGEHAGGADDLNKYI